MLKSFRPEAVVSKFFAAARTTAVCQYWSVYEELRQLENSDPLTPCVALRRGIEENVVMTLPGFDANTSATVLAGAREIILETGSFT